MEINNYINPERGLADTGENGGLGPQDQVQLPASEVQKKGKVMKQTCRSPNTHALTEGSHQDSTAQYHTGLKPPQGLRARRLLPSKSGICVIAAYFGVGKKL